MFSLRVDGRGRCVVSCVAVLRCLSLVHGCASVRCASFRRRPSCFPCCCHLQFAPVMLSPESSRATMFGCTDGYMVCVWIVSRWIVEPCLEDYREPFTVGVESSLNPIDGTLSAITTVSRCTVRGGEGVVEGVCAGVG
jgi:hypothetical protein